MNENDRRDEFDPKAHPSGMPELPKEDDYENVEDLIASILEQIRQEPEEQQEDPTDTIMGLRTTGEKDLPVQTDDATLAFVLPEMEQQPEDEPTRVIPTAEKKTEKPKKKVKRSKTSAAQKAMLYILAVITASALLAVFAWNCALDVLALTKPDREVSVTIAQTDTIADVTDKLYDSGLIEYKWLFRIYCSFANAERKIDPGVYTLNNFFDYHALVNGLIGTAPTRDTVTVTIPEGFEAEQIFALLEEKGVCAADKLTDAAANHVFDYDFLSHLDYGAANRLEGYLFPDTYDFYVDEQPDTVIEKLLDNYAYRVDDELLAQIDALNARLRERMTQNGMSEAEINAAMMDEQKIIIVASLIEKETAGASESSTIASVIYNRLCSKDYPLLQIDATIQYVLSERKENLTAQDLQINSPYNTYANPGLPVGPIANPGLSSIKAALDPEATTYYFYALDKDGSHHFSSSYYEHRDFLEGLEE